MPAYAQTALEYNNQGDTKYEKSDYKGALEDYSKAIKLDPKYAQAYFNRGMAKENLNDNDGAINDYTTAIKLDSATYQAVAQEFIDSLREYKATMNRYDETVKLDPDNAKNYADRAFYRFERKQDYAGAIADYNKAIELNPNDADSYYGRGYIKSLNDGDQGAITDYDKAIALEPNAAIWYYNRGESKYALKNYQAAVADWQKTIELIAQHKSYLPKGEVSAGIIQAQISDAKQKLKND